MNFKSILLVVLCLFSRAAAEPALQIHDGTGWREIDAATWDKLPRTELVGKARDGSDRRFAGVALSEILKLLNAPAGDALRGPEMKRIVLFSAKDNYQVAFSLTELDASFRKQNVILADRVDGQPLSEFEGSRMLVMPDDLRHSRWIRQVTRIALSKVELPKP